MPIGMPYHLEKGPTLRLLERHLNADASAARAALDQLRASKGSSDWVEHVFPQVWQDPAFAASPSGSGAATRDAILAKWFGCDPAGQVLPTPNSTTGYWIAYEGDVAEIVRRTLCWALELAFGLAPGESRRGRTTPWSIELFWKCPTPWFEGWVVTRPLPGHGLADVALRGHSAGGLVSVFFLTPSHEGANVSEQPIAVQASTKPTSGNHPVPSWQDDYEQLGHPHPDPAAYPNRPRVPAKDRRWATWVVTHEDHVTEGSINVTTNTAAAADFSDWGIPQLGIYRGRGDVVVVAPSAAAGGVKEDGSL